MENVHKFSSREDIEAQAADWLIRFDSERALEAEELLRFREWLQSNPAHPEELIRLNEFWSDQSLVALPIPLEQLCYEAMGHKVTESKQGEEVLIPWYHWQGFTARSTLALASMLVIMILSVPWLSTDFFSAAQHNALYATAIGQQQTITLADGSVMVLNTNSQVKVDYRPQYRNIHLLQGEAYFEVAKQAERPFRVYAGRGRVQAVGTAFSVYIQQNADVDVVVTEGTIALALLAEKTQQHNSGSPQKPVTGSERSTTESSEYFVAMPVDELGLLEAGHETTILVAQNAQTTGDNKLGQVKSLPRDELERRGAWRSGLLVFSGTTLEDVVKEISRYTTLSIDIVDPELKAIRIGGRFSVNSTGALFDALEANFGLQVKRQTYNRIEISSADTEQINKK